MVAKYEALLEIQRNPRPKMPQQQLQPQSLLDELNSADFSSLNTKFTADDEKKSGARHKTPTDFSEVETTSSGYSDEISTKATQTDNSSFLFTIVDGENGKFSIYDEAAGTTQNAPIDTRFRERPQYRELFKEIFGVLKKAAENKEEGDALPLLDDNEKQAAQEETSKVPPVTPAAEQPPCDFDTQSIMSSAMSENSVAISECITKSERKKVKSYKKQAAKEEIENRPPVVQVIGGKLVTPYNRVALDLAALNAKKRARRSRRASRDKYGTPGRDSSVCSNASGTSNASSTAQQSQLSQNENQSTSTTVEQPQQTREPEKQTQAPLTPSRMRKIRRPRELLQLQTLSTLSAGEWNGDSLTIYNKKAKANNPVGFYCRPNSMVTDSGEVVEFKASAASQELKKLKKLDLSYAEVLKQSERQRRHRRK